jgi:hypothetical protein
VPSENPTGRPARRKAVEYEDDGKLRAAVRDYCLAEWSKLTGRQWTEENDRNVQTCGASSPRTAKPSTATRHW